MKTDRSNRLIAYACDKNCIVGIGSFYALAINDNSLSIDERKNNHRTETIFEVTMFTAVALRRSNKQILIDHTSVSEENNRFLRSEND